MSVELFKSSHCKVKSVDPMVRCLKLSTRKCLNVLRPSRRIRRARRHKLATTFDSFLDSIYIKIKTSDGKGLLILPEFAHELISMRQLDKLVVVGLYLPGGVRPCTDRHQSSMEQYMLFYKLAPGSFRILPDLKRRSIHRRTTAQKIT